MKSWIIIFYLFNRKIIRDNYNGKVGVGAPVYVPSVLEYFTANY
jgi:hypothetical protein